MLCFKGSDLDCEETPFIAAFQVIIIEIQRI